MTAAAPDSRGLPAPLTPAGCDLRSFDWFPLFHKRLLGSSFWSRSSDQVCRISVDLWAKAYEQVPAASLPNDDYLLADWSGFGRRNLAGWLAIKAEVLSAWTHCSDDRFYHPTLSEVACKAWVERRLHLWKRECERVRKDNLKRKDKGIDPLELPEKPSDDPFEDVGKRTVSAGKPEISAGTRGLSAGIPPETASDPPDVRRNSVGSPTSSDGIPAENALKGTGTGTTPSGISSADKSSEAHLPSDDPPRRPPDVDPDDPISTMFALGKRLWGPRQGGSLVGKLRKAVCDDRETAGLMCDIAQDMGAIDGKSYLMGIVKSRERSAELTPRDRGDAW